MRLLIALACFGFSLSAIAMPVDQSGFKCERNLTFDFITAPTSGYLSDDEIAALKSGSQVTKFYGVPNSDYLVGYIFRVAAYDPELVMAVYAQANLHAGKNGLGDFIKRSEIVGSDPDHPSDPYKVFYEQRVQIPYDNGEYTMENAISVAGGTYYQNSRLIDSTSASFSPRWADGYFKAYPLGSGVFVVACNYMVPRGSSWVDTFNDLSRERLTKSGVNLLNWVKRVSQNQDETSRVRARLRGMLKTRGR